jgi:cytochrome c oxidase cbb3-type subunit 2
MKMTPLAVVVRLLLILATIVFVVVLLPYATPARPHLRIFSASARPKEAAGRKLYIANGCVYCHSQSIRTIDWGLGAERIAQAGDYVSRSPHPAGFPAHRAGPVPGRRRTPDDWHMAHFMNPRYTRPLSIMPAFKFWATTTWATSSATSRAWA